MARSIGEVYVTVLANTKAFTSQAEKAAKRDGNALGLLYGNEFAKAVKKAELDSVFDDIAKKVARKFAQSNKDIGKDLRFGLADLRLADAMGPELDRLAAEFGITVKELEAGIADSFGGAFATIEREFKDAERATAEYEKSIHDAYKENERFNKQQQAALDAQVRLVERARAADSKRTKDQQKAWQELGRIMAQAEAEDVRRTEQKRVAWDRLGRQMEVAIRLNDEFDRGSRRTYLGLRRNTGEASRFEKKVAGWKKALRRAGTGGVFDVITNLLAGLIGITGAVTEGFFNVGTAITENVIKLAGRAATKLDNLADSFQALGKEGTAAALRGVSSLVMLVAELPVSAVAAAVAVAALYVGLGVLGVAAGIVAAALSAVAGILVIIGSALSFAIGSLVIVGPLFAALAAAAGVLFISLKDVFGAIGKFNKVLDATNKKDRAKALEDYNTALKNMDPAAAGAVRSLEPLLRLWQDISKQVSNNFWTSIGDSLKGLTPIFKVMGDGLNAVAIGLGGAVANSINLFSQKPVLDAFSKLWGAVAIIANNMGTAFGTFLVAVTQFFAAISPWAVQFSDSLLGIVTKFSEWLTTSSGQNAVANFMTAAYDAGSALWGIVTTLVTAFGNLFNGSKDQGQAFLDKILELSQTFADWIVRVTTDGSLERWLTEAWNVATLLWNAAKTIGETFADLNTPQNQQFLRWVLSTITLTITFINGLLKLLQPVITGFVIVGNAIQIAGEKVSDFIGWLKKITVPAPLREIGNIFGKIWSAASGGFSLPKFPLTAAGGVFGTPQARIIGEAGPEAVVPLTRPLGMVDPSVRSMAAMLRGQGTASGGASNVITLNVYPQQSDPAAVAESVVNRIASLVV